MLRVAHQGKSEEIIEANSPFELHPTGSFQAGGNRPYRRGILLTHGLTDSPYMMRHLGSFFAQQGFRVMAILLPGHGTQPGDLLDIKWQQWRDMVAFGVEQLSLEAEEIYLAGFSIGGALSIYHSQQDARVRGLFLFSPALKISSKAAFANWHKLSSWLIPSHKWLSICPDRDICKYESVPKQAIAEAWALSRKLDLNKVAIPVFSAASLEDATVDTSVEFIRRAKPGHLVLYSAKPVESDNPSVEIINSCLPGQQILSYSHVAIVIPPNDPHYGASGDYCSCHHYYPHEMQKYTACMDHPEQAMTGELSSLHKGLLRRLTYNPEFERLKCSMKKFIVSLP